MFVQGLGQHSNMDTSQDMEDPLSEEFEGIGTPVNPSFLNSLYCRVGQYYDIIGHHDIKCHDN